MKVTTPPPLRILIINPNTTTAMTEALRPAISTLHIPPTTAHFSYFTCPASASGIPSINSPADAAASATACIPHLTPLLAHHDAFLVACYSEHPLVQWLRSNLPSSSRKYVTGIFEASVAASLSLTATFGDKAGFGIVSTGAAWGPALGEAVDDFVGVQTPRFLGCETTGLNADELHRLPAEEVRVKMKEATKRVILKGKEKGLPVRAVCLGCAGMVGLEVAVREALVEEMGEEEAGLVAVVDGVKAGVGQLVMLAGGGF